MCYRKRSSYKDVSSISNLRIFKNSANVSFAGSQPHTDIPRMPAETLEDFLFIEEYSKLPQKANALMFAKDGQRIKVQAAKIGNAFGKLKRTLSTVLLPSTSTKSIAPPTVDADLPITPPIREKLSLKVGRPDDKTSACRICLKILKREDTRKMCTKCNYPICEDCVASPIKTETGKLVKWKCTVCNRKLKSLSTTRRRSRSVSDIPKELLENVACPHTSGSLTRKSMKMGKTTTMSAFPISGEYYYDVTNIGPGSSASTGSRPSDYSAEARQLWSRRSEISTLVSSWSTYYDAEDLNATLRRLLIHTENTLPDSPSLIKVAIRRDLTSMSSTTRGLGMYVTGGRVGTFIYWIEPGGPAESTGLKEGDWILEWNNLLLINRSVEEVTLVISGTEPIVNLTIKRPPDLTDRDLSCAGSTHPDSDFDHVLSTSSTSRKLSVISE